MTYGTVKSTAPANSAALLFPKAAHLLATTSPITRTATFTRMSSMAADVLMVSHSVFG
jgi:hypothetical protein